MPAKKDVYEQFMYLTVTQSAANTLTFGKVAIGMSLFDYAAFIISRIEYTLATATLDEMSAETDIIEGAICGSDTLTTLSLTQAEVYDYMKLRVQNWGTAANAGMFREPIVHDFTSMEGGGLLVPAQDVFLGLDTSGFTAAGSITARCYYRVKELNAADFIELVQRLRVLST